MAVGSSGKAVGVPGQTHSWQLGEQFIWPSPCPCCFSDSSLTTFHPLHVVYAKSAALLPGFTDRQPALPTILEKPVSLAEGWLHTVPALWSTIPLSFLGCTALSSVQSTKHHNATCGNSQSLHDLVTYIS